MRLSIVLLVVASSLIFGCQKSEYHRLVTKEMSSGEINDSLIVGISFGMNSLEFYTHCWEQHKKGVMGNSESNSDVRLPLQQYHPKLAADFYPLFHKDKIWQLPVTFYFDDHSEWNKDLSQDTLQQYASEVIEEWFGEDFISLTRETIFGEEDYKVTVDGNRQVIVFPIQPNKYKIEVTDLNIKKEAEAFLKKKSSKVKG